MRWLAGLLLMQITSEARRGSILKGDLVSAIRLHGKITTAYCCHIHFPWPACEAKGSEWSWISLSSCTSPRVHIPEQDEAFQCSNSI